ncbi:hypothetical protein PsYK624_081230 [Phanerochaete sordida]|uniref:Uncharacterized protein n=1 Tax=Phanerochaete sordida TaxID=48140 RepID=A0A9P3GBS5_9APHY|nr:hypothetical protein PsYK624_081230 [Phanerochaete sordida]
MNSRRWTLETYSPRLHAFYSRYCIRRLYSHATYLQQTSVAARERELCRSASDRSGIASVEARLDLRHRQHGKVFARHDPGASRRGR